MRIRTPRALVVVSASMLGMLGVLASACETHDEGGTSAPPSPAALQSGPVAAPEYVRLPRGVPVGARPELDRGLTDPNRRIENLSMVFKLSPAQIADREALKDALIDPASPSYHKWLTPDQYAARFGAAQVDVDRAKDWLASQGLEVHEASRLGSRVAFSGTVGRLQAAFRTEIHDYAWSGEKHYAMSANPQLPADLARVVLDVVNTHDFHPRSMSHRVSPVADYKAGTVTGFAPPDWANVYDVTPAYSPGIAGRPLDGSGVTIAVVGIAKIAQSDIDAWRTRFGLPSSTVTTTLVPGTGPAQGDNGSGFEAALDVEWSGGIAKGATVDYVYTGANDGNVDDATIYAIENDLGSVLSTSWGGCDAVYVEPAPGGLGLESSDQNVIDVYGSAANLLGITIVASSGDWGATTCLDKNLGGAGGLFVSVPAAFPGVTAVGGTQFATGSFTAGSSGYFTGYSTAEHVWNEQHTGTGTSPQVAATGGGISVFFSRPSYQLGLPTCTPVGSLPSGSIVAANMRQIPDVSFTAAGVTTGQIPLLAACVLDSSGTDCTATGSGTVSLVAGAGTSFSAPAFAGVVALMNQLENGPLGNINPMLYALEGTTGVHDVTVGNNEVSCNGTDPGCGSGNLYGYAAATGYDCATGIGSLDVANFLTSMASFAATTTTLSANPTSTNEGTPVALSATVSLPTGASSSHLLAGGTVTFAFQSYDQNGRRDVNAGSWVLGTGTLAGDASSGTASLSIAIPPGLVKPCPQTVDVYAVYGGDANHAPSTSAKVTVHFPALTLAITPDSPTVPVNGSKTFTASGGSGSIKWFTGTDTTCSGMTAMLCSGIDEFSGAFTAGEGKGTTQVLAMDSAGAYALTTVYVGMAPPDGGAPPATCVPIDAGSPADASVPPSDSGPTTGTGNPPDASSTQDASAAADGGSLGSDASGSAAGDADTDAEPAGDDGGADGTGSGGGSSGKSGCGCKVEGARSNDANGAWLASLLLASLWRRRLRSSRRTGRRRRSRMPRRSGP